jgi:hypothetical protein
MLLKINASRIFSKFNVEIPRKFNKEIKSFKPFKKALPTKRKIPLNSQDENHKINRKILFTTATHLRAIKRQIFKLKFFHKIFQFIKWEKSKIGIFSKLISLEEFMDFPIIFFIFQLSIDKIFKRSIISRNITLSGLWLELFHVKAGMGWGNGAGMRKFMA